MGATLPPPLPSEAPTPSAASPTPRRRAVVVAAVIASVAAAAIAAIVLADGSPSDQGDGWNAVAAVDRRTGTVTLYDAEGDVVRELDSGVGSVDYVLGEDRHVAVVGRGRAAIVDVADGTIEAPALPADARATRISTNRRLTLAAAPPNGGPATIITPDDTFDVERVAQLDDPFVFIEGVKSDANGTVFAVPEARSSQTVVIGPDRAEAVVVPGLPIGVTDEVVVTIQPTGPRSQIQFATLDGERVGASDIPSPAVALLNSDDDVILVTTDGDVLRARRGDDEAERVTTLDLRGDVVAGATALDGQRLVISSDRGVAVLDDSGRPLSTVALDDTLLRQPIVRHPSQRCVLAITADGTATMIDVDSGESLGVVDRVLSVGGTSIDGCTASVVRSDDFALMREGMELRVDRDEVVVAIAPDGDHVVVRDRDGRTWLRDLEGEGTDGVVLDTNTDSLYAFVDG